MKGRIVEYAYPTYGIDLPEGLMQKCIDLAPRLLKELGFYAPNDRFLSHLEGKAGIRIENQRVYFDTAVAPAEDVRHVLDHVGAERVIFGSDVSGTREPFHNFTRVERVKVESLGLSESEAGMVFAGNIERIVRRA